MSFSSIYLCLWHSRRTPWMLLLSCLSFIFSAHWKIIAIICHPSRLFYLFHALFDSLCLLVSSFFLSLVLFSCIHSGRLLSRSYSFGVIFAACNYYPIASRSSYLWWCECFRSAFFRLCSHAKLPFASTECKHSIILCALFFPYAHATLPSAVRMAAFFSVAWHCYSSYFIVYAAVSNLFSSFFFIVCCRMRATMLLLLFDLHITNCTENLEFNAKKRNSNSTSNVQLLKKTAAGSKNWNCTKCKFIYPQNTYRRDRLPMILLLSTLSFRISAVR